MTKHHLDVRRVDATHGQGAAHVVALTGEIDATNASELDEALREASASGPVILDLSAVEFFDSAGFAVLDRRLGGGGLFIAISPNSVIRRAASLVGIPFRDSVEDAISAIAAGVVQSD